MPIPLPNLDDRTYADLTDEARALIPRLLRDWTDHNPSDPGIVLVELLAWLTEMLLFQVDDIPEASTEGFLKLLNGGPVPRRDGDTLDDAVRTTMRGLRERYRAVTADDFEHLTLHAWPTSPEAVALIDAVADAGAPAVARVRAVPRRDLTTADPEARSDQAPSHVSLVVVPPRSSAGAATPWTELPQPGAPLLAALAGFFAPRCTLTTRLHLVGPTYAPVAVSAHVALSDDADPDETFREVFRAVGTFVDPLVGGPDAAGWEFGRHVYASEVYAVLERVPAVDYVGSVEMSGDRPIVVGNDTVGIRLDADQLPRFAALGLVAHDSGGQRHEYGGVTP